MIDESTLIDIIENKTVERESQVKFEDLTHEAQLWLFENNFCFDYPRSCVTCPSGYSCSGEYCGRHTPFWESDYTTRPKSCKLTKIVIMKETILKVT